MDITLLLLVSTISAFVTTKLVSRRYGPITAQRFFERNADYTADTLKAWIKDYPTDAAAYAVPVLFPLDMICMTLLSAFLAVASISVAELNSSFRGFAMGLHSITGSISHSRPCRRHSPGTVYIISRNSNSSTGEIRSDNYGNKGLQRSVSF